MIDCRWHQFIVKGSTMPLRTTVLVVVLCCLLTHKVEAWTARVLPRSQTKLSSRSFPISSRLQSASVSATESTLPRITSKDLQELAEKKYVVMPNFLPQNLQDALREDIQTLRQADQFSIARIGQDATNQLNQDIRIAETCFIGPDKLKDTFPDPARGQLYTVLDQVRQDLSTSSGKPLDTKLTELLYVFYPQGGFYRRHRDAIPGSASVLRTFSLLLYLNKDWTEQDGGKLRMHMDSGGDELPPGEKPNFIDVKPEGGTLVLFESDAIPHEVLDTQKERMAVVGWYNRPVSVSDIAELSGGGIGGNRLVLLGIAAALVTVGVIQLVGG